MLETSADFQVQGDPLKNLDNRPTRWLSFDIMLMAELRKLQKQFNNMKDKFFEQFRLYQFSDLLGLY